MTMNLAMSLPSFPLSGHVLLHQMEHAYLLLTAGVRIPPAAIVNVLAAWGKRAAELGAPVLEAQSHTA